MKCLIIGYGSIGSRHARVLEEMGCHVAVVSRHSSEYPIIYREIKQAVKEEGPDYIVIANTTSEHFRTLKCLLELGFKGRILVEKPLFEDYHELDVSSLERIHVGYNLRFHPIIVRLHGLLQKDSILSVQAYVGQYLPGWRPGRDYRQCYSSDKLTGGGVIRDLSHELDYLNWLLGGWKRLVAVGGRLSSLSINSDDFFSLMLEMNDCPVVNAQLNYMDRITQRQVILIGENKTYQADFIKGTLNIDGNEETLVVDRDYTYRAMHQAVLNMDYEKLCSYEQGLEITKMIRAAESSNSDERWVYND